VAVVGRRSSVWWSTPPPNPRYFTPLSKELGYHVGGSGSIGTKPPFAPNQVKTLADWQRLTTNDVGSTISADMDIERAIQQASSYLQLPSSR
jgi:hypothetical protein